MKIAIINSSQEVYNLATHRIAHYHERLGDTVTLTKGSQLFLDGVWNADKAYFSCIFTWDLKEMCANVNLLKERDIAIEIGGPAATAMPVWVENRTGIKPHVGLDDRFEREKGDFKMEFTSRGCRNHCAWCIVPKIEPIHVEYEDINIPVGDNPYLGDNNLLACSWEHQKRVVGKLKNVSNLDINSGFEASLFTEDHYALYSQLKLERWRLAFDSMAVEKEFERAVNILKKHGVRYSEISTYVLIGFPGTTYEETIYRLEKARSLGTSPYPQIYRPLNSINHDYVAPGWDKEKLSLLRMYWITPQKWRTCTFEEFQLQYTPPDDNVNPHLFTL